jgi:hypothetical protein
MRFNPPANWPPPPEGWVPEPGWQPDPAWGPPPEGWQVWISDGDADALEASSAPPPTAAADPSRDVPTKVPLFGARSMARRLAGEVTRLQTEQDVLQSTMSRLGVLDVAELERRKSALANDIVDQQTQLNQAAADQASKLEAESEEAIKNIAELHQQIAQLQQQVVVTTDVAMLQEAGIYEYRHPLDDAVAYEAELGRLKSEIRAMNLRDGGAVRATTNWTVNSSAAQGRIMVRDFSKLMLRAYNAEADNLVRSMKPYKLEAAVDRLSKVALTIEKLGRTMDIRITNDYHQLRVRELELAADYAAKVAEEKEREHEEKLRLREERQAQLELERERARLDKERQHHANVLQTLIDNGDAKGAARIKKKLAEIDAAIANVDYRAANIRAGYVYVISNIGAFGERMVKVGMTRRLEPLDRVRELGDASVPFRFDIHALFFSDDAVGIEAQMHARLEQFRVNRVNPRREFFYCTPQEAKTHLLDLAGELLQFDENAEAVEYRQSRNADRVPETPRPTKAAVSAGKPGRSRKPPKA